MHAWAGVFCSQLLGSWIRKSRVLGYHGRASSLSYLLREQLSSSLIKILVIVFLCLWRFCAIPMTLSVASNRREILSRCILDLFDPSSICWQHPHAAGFCSSVNHDRPLFGENDETPVLASECTARSEINNRAREQSLRDGDIFVDRYKGQSECNHISKPCKYVYCEPWFTTHVHSSPHQSEMYVL